MATKLQIDRFLSDPSYLALTGLEREQRLLFITDLSETRVSAFLGWLFRPHEGHGLGDQAFRELMLNAWRTNDTDQLGLDVPSPNSILDSSFRDLLVRTEYAIPGDSEGRKKSRAIDILLVSRSNKMVVAIENKFGSGVYPNQLHDYRSALESAFPNYRRVFVYLDSDEEAKPDDSAWIGLSYQWLIDLISTHQASGLLSDRALEALAQVKDYLEEDATLPGELEEKKDLLIEAIASRHADVLEIFRTYRRAKWNAFLLDPIQGHHEPLVIEYHQRWWLWDDVLDQARHASIIYAAKKAFGSRLEVSAGPAEARFRLGTWSRFEIDPSKGQWGPSVTTWCGREARGDYKMWSSVNFRGVQPDAEPALRSAALSLRRDMKKPPKAAHWMRLDEKSRLSIESAGSAVIHEIGRLDAVFGALK